MASYLGIDIGHSAVRAVLIRTAYRKVTLAGMGSCELSGVDLSEALRVAVGGLAHRCDGVAVTLPGEQVFLRRLEIPATAAKQLAEVVPFEIEAQIPFDIAEAVFDFRSLPRGRERDKLDVFAAIARQQDVRARIDLVQSAAGAEPELVIPGAFSLSSLIPAVAELAAAGTLALVDIGAVRTEMVVATRGEVLFARTLSVGAQGLPASAAVLARELRQSVSAFRAAGGAPVEAMYLSGGGSLASGADVFLAGELGIPVQPLPMPRVEGVGPEQAAQMPRFTKALALAMSFGARSRLLNLRQGPLAFERGYGFLREKIPVLAGLGMVIVMSSLFATWAEMRALSNEHDVLEDGLAAVSKDVLGEETRDPARAIELVDQGPGGKDEDPLPQADAFDVLVQIADAVSPDLKHDIEELDVARAGPQAPQHVSVHGVVPKVQDAEDLATILKAYPCFQDVKILKTTQMIGGDGQKYTMDFDLKCVSPEKKPKPAPSSSGDAAPAGSAKGDK